MSLSRRPCLEISIADSRKRSASVSSESPSTPPGALNYPTASPGIGNTSSNSIQLLGIEQVEAEDPRSWSSGTGDVFRTRARAASMPEKSTSLVSFADEHEHFDERSAKAVDQMSSSIPIPSTLGLSKAADDPEALWEGGGSMERIRNLVSHFETGEIISPHFLSLAPHHASFSCRSPPHTHTPPAPRHTVCEPLGKSFQPRAGHRPSALIRWHV